MTHKLIIDNYCYNSRPYKKLKSKILFTYKILKFYSSET